MSSRDKLRESIAASAGEAVLASGPARYDPGSMGSMRRYSHVTAPAVAY